MSGPGASSLARSVRARLSLVGVVGVLAFMLVPAAHAGTYTVWSCKTSAGTPTSTAGWSAASSLPSMFPSDDCGTPGGTLAVNFAGSPTSTTYTGGQGMHWEFTAPADTTVTDVFVDRGWLVGHNGADSYASAGIGVYRDGFAYDPQHLLWQCQAYFTGDGYCYSGGGKESYAINASRFGFDAGCYGVSSGTCGGDPNGKAVQTFGATRIHLDDPYGPAATALTGDPATATTLQGTETLNAVLADRGSGIWQAQVSLGSTVLVPRATVDANGDHCKALAVEPGVSNAFGWPQPCKLQANASWSLDTTKVPDGAQQLTVTVWDAAGNATTVLDRKVTVDNVPDLASTKQSSNATGTLTLDTDAATVPFKTKRTIAGRLVDQAGKPIASARLKVSELIAYAGATSADVGTVTTDADGRFSYPIAPTASRTISFTYAPAGRDPLGVVFALKVTSQVSFKAAKSRLRHGSQVRLSGRVYTRPLPKKGVRVAIEVRVKGKWETASGGLVRTTSTGTFKWNRTLSSVTTYKFRARVLASSDFPGEPASSRTVAVRLR